MLARSGRLVLVLVAAASTSVLAQGFEYAPVAAQYRITSKTTGAQEAMGQKQPFETSNNQLLSVTLTRPSRDTLAMTIVIDSINAIGPMGAPPQGIEKLPGVKVAAKLAPFGAVYSATGPQDDSIPQGSQITDEMSRFLPRIRKPLAPGASWSDTTAGKIKQGGLDVDRRAVSNYTVVGDTTIGSDKTWKISRESVTSLSGSGTNMGQPMTMEGTSNGKAMLLVSQKGVFVSSDNEDQANIKIVLAANGMEIGVTTTANTKIQKVK
jgi:hypothetical protein